MPTVARQWAKPDISKRRQSPLGAVAMRPRAPSTLPIVASVRQIGFSVFVLER
jgi:hypothetical protein